MLTKDDLKQIRIVVREEVETETQAARDDIQVEIKLVRMELASRISKVEDRLKNVEIKINRMEKDIKHLKADVSVAIKLLDEDIIKLRKRVEKLEDN